MCHARLVLAQAYLELDLEVAGDQSPNSKCQTLDVMSNFAKIYVATAMKADLVAPKKEGVV